MNHTTSHSLVFFLFVDYDLVFVSLTLSLSEECHNSCGKEPSPCNVNSLIELLVTAKESYAIHVAIGGDFAVHLVGEESLQSIVELVLVHVHTHVSQEVVWPVCDLNSMSQAVVLGDPEPSLKVLQVRSRVEGISRCVKWCQSSFAIVSTVLLLG